MRHALNANLAHTTHSSLTRVIMCIVPIIVLLVLPRELHLNATNQAQLPLLLLLSLPMVHGPVD